MKVLTAAVLAFSLSVPAAMAADTAAPLGAGRPAGVKQAQTMNNTVWIVGAVAIAAAGIALAASGGNGGDVTPGTTATTTTTS
jgi:hypothetical protein